MRRIKQEDATGCGIACAAMIAGVSYARARTRAVELGLVDCAPPHYTSSRQLRQLVGSFGATASRGRRLTHWTSLSELSIVGINYNEKSDTWHWVVYVPSTHGGYVLDPRAAVKADRRYDFPRMRPRSFIPIELPRG